MTREQPPKLGPFWSAMRSTERRIYKEALEAAGGDTRVAAGLLQISTKWLTQRSRYIGGVFKDDPVNEPPRDLVEPPDPNAPRRGRPPKAKPGDEPDGDDDDEDDDNDTEEGGEATSKETPPPAAAEPEPGPAAPETAPEAN